MENNDTGENRFLTVDEAVEMAFTKIIKSIFQEDEKVKVYVWRARYKKDQLSKKLIKKILEMAGFSKAVEEKWVVIDEKPEIKKNIKSEIKQFTGNPFTEETFMK